MIVVGIVERERPGPVLAVARLAAAAGARVEVVGVVPPDEAGERITLQLAQAGVGHATITRSAVAETEPADLDLALRYLPDVRAVVLLRPPARLVPTATALASWSGAALVLVDGPTVDDATSAGPSGAEGGPPVIELEGPSDGDPDETFAGFVAALVVRLDAGDEPSAAWSAALATSAADPVD